VFLLKLCRIRSIGSKVSSVDNAKVSFTSEPIAFKYYVTFDVKFKYDTSWSTEINNTTIRE